MLKRVKILYVTDMSEQIFCIIYVTVDIISNIIPVYFCVAETLNVLGRGRTAFC